MLFSTILERYLHRALWLGTKLHLPWCHFELCWHFMHDKEKCPSYSLPLRNSFSIQAGQLLSQKQQHTQLGRWGTTSNLTGSRMEWKDIPEASKVLCHDTPPGLQTAAQSARHCFWLSSYLVHARGSSFTLHCLLDSGAFVARPQATWPQRPQPWFEEISHGFSKQ